MLEKHQIAGSFSRAASTYDLAAGLQCQVADRLLALYQDKLSYLNIGTTIDLGSGTDYCANILRKNISAPVFSLDIAEGMILHAKKRHDSLPKNSNKSRWICADIDKLPIKASSIDLVVSSLSLQWCENLNHSFGGIYRILNSKSWFLFSTLAEATLFELKSAWSQLDARIHVNNFPSSQSIKEALKLNGFSIVEHVNKKEIVEYDSVIDLMRNLQLIGAHNMNQQRHLGLTGKEKLLALERQYENFRVYPIVSSNAKSYLPATYDVQYFLCKKNP